MCLVTNGTFLELVVAARCPFHPFRCQNHPCEPKLLFIMQHPIMKRYGLAEDLENTICKIRLVPIGSRIIHVSKVNSSGLFIRSWYLTPKIKWFHSSGYISWLEYRQKQRCWHTWYKFTPLLKHLEQNVHFYSWEVRPLNIFSHVLMTVLHGTTSSQHNILCSSEGVDVSFS